MDTGFEAFFAMATRVSGLPVSGICLTQPESDSLRHYCNRKAPEQLSKNDPIVRIGMAAVKVMRIEDASRGESVASQLVMGAPYLKSFILQKITHPETRLRLGFTYFATSTAHKIPQSGIEALLAMNQWVAHIAAHQQNKDIIEDQQAARVGFRAWA